MFLIFRLQDWPRQALGMPEHLCSVNPQLAASCAWAWESTGVHVPRQDLRVSWDQVRVKFRVNLGQMTTGKHPQPLRALSDRP